VLSSYEIISNNSISQIYPSSHKQKPLGDWGLYKKSLKVPVTTDLVCS